MLPRVRIRATARTPGLDKAERTYISSLNNTLEGLGKHLQRALRGRVRKARGDEQRGVKYEVRGQGLNKVLVVFGALIQLWIDEYGLRPGVFPPWKIGSRLFKYVQRLGLTRTAPKGVRRPTRLASHVQTRRPGPRRAPGIQRVSAAGKGRGASATQHGARRKAAPAGKGRDARGERRAKATQRIAFLIARKIFESGIAAARPIAKTFEANRAKIIRDVSLAFVRATNKINRGS